MHSHGSVPRPDFSTRTQRRRSRRGPPGPPRSCLLPGPAELSPGRPPSREAEVAGRVGDGVQAFHGEPASAPRCRGWGRGAWGAWRGVPRRLGAGGPLSVSACPGARGAILPAGARSASLRWPRAARPADVRQAPGRVPSGVPTAWTRPRHRCGSRGQREEGPCPCHLVAPPPPRPRPAAPRAPAPGAGDLPVIFT